MVAIALERLNVSHFRLGMFKENQETRLKRRTMASLDRLISLFSRNSMGSLDESASSESVGMMTDLTSQF